MATWVSSAQTMMTPVSSVPTYVMSSSDDHESPSWSHTAPPSLESYIKAVIGNPSDSIAVPSISASRWSPTNTIYNLFANIRDLLHRCQILRSPAFTEGNADAIQQKLLDAFWNSGTSDPSSWTEEEEKLREIPAYVLEYAPLIYLHENENFWPGDIAEHLLHTTPFLNYTPIEAEDDHPTLDNLDDLNQWGRAVYLQSNDNVEDCPAWLRGEHNIPATNKSRRSTTMRLGGKSSAPAILVVVPKAHGIVDAFWFFFYSYNLGNVVFKRFGNHVGDWEHTLVRFKDGRPHQVFFSEHSWGSAFTYQAVEKIGRRPVGYSATGTHAMYGKAGVHRYVLPFGILHDETTHGPLWDPALNCHSYTFDLSDGSVRASNHTPKSPTAWFNFRGHWGDKRYPLNDPRQYTLFGQYHYGSGPTGPIAKDLGREQVCQGFGPCVVKNWIGKGDSVEWKDEHELFVDDEDDRQDDLGGMRLKSPSDAATANL